MALRSFFPSNKDANDKIPVAGNVPEPVVSEPAHAQPQTWAPVTPMAPIAPEPQAPSSPAYSVSGDNMLNADVEVKGKLKFTNNLLIDGIVEGEITSDGTLTVGQNARITASIKTNSVIIYGKVYGNINVNDRVELKKTAELVGDIKAATIAIEAGAIFIGRSEVGVSSQRGASTPTTPTKPAPTPKSTEPTPAPTEEAGSTLNLG